MELMLKFKKKHVVRFFKVVIGYVGHRVLLPHSAPCYKWTGLLFAVYFWT